MLISHYCYQVFPSAGTMAHHRFPVQPHDFDDGTAASAHNDFAEDAQRPRDEERNGAARKFNKVWTAGNVGYGNEFLSGI